MSTQEPSIHADGPPTTEPGMTATAKVFVGLGIAGGLVTVTACVAVIMGLIERADRAEVAPVASHEQFVRALQQEQPEASKGPVVLTPSSDRFQAPPDEPLSSAAAQDAEQIARDRTQVAIQARFVELDLTAAARLAGDVSLEPGLAHGVLLLEPLARAKPEQCASVLSQIEPAALVAALPELEEGGVARVLSAPKLTTRHRVPAAIVEKDDLVAAGGAEAPARVCSRTFRCVPEVLGPDEVSVEVSAEISRQGEGEGARPQTSSVATSVKLRDGQTVAIGGLTKTSVAFGSARERDFRGAKGDCAKTGEKHEALVVLLSAQVQPPVGPEARTPLAETELRRRHQQQCRFVEEEIARQFPESQVELVAAAGKLFVRGRAKDDEQLAGIMAVVRRRVAAWQIVDGPAVQTATGRPGAEAPDNPNVVMMLRTPPVPQILFRMRLFEVDRDVAAKAVDEAGDRADDRALLAALMELDDARRSTVLDGLEGEKLEAALEALRGRGLVRVLSEPTLCTVNRHKATLAVGGEVSLPDITGRAAGEEKPSSDAPGTGVQAAPEAPNQVHIRHRELLPERPGSYRCGMIIHALPVVLDEDRLRVEVTRDVQRVVEDGRASEPARLVLSSQGLTAVAVMRSGQTLAVGDFPEQRAAGDEGPRPRGAEGPARQFLLVTAEIVQPTEAKPAAALARRVEAGPEERPIAAAAPQQQIPIALPPEPSDQRALREFFRKADRADYQEKIDGRLARTAAAQLGREATVQVLQDVLGELFPQSEVSLELDRDKLTVVGRARNADEAAQIMTVVRGQVPALRSSVGALRVVDRVGTTELERVALRTTFLAVNPAQVGNSPEHLQPRSPKSGKLTGALVELAEKGGHTVLDPAACGDVGTGIRALGARRLVRVLSEPVVVTQSRRPCRVVATGENLGTLEATVTFLPVVLSGGQIRLEFARESGHREGTLRYPDTARPATAAAELPLGTTLAIAGPFEEGAAAKPDRSGERLILLVTPEVARPAPGQEEAWRYGQAKPPGREAVTRVPDPGAAPRATREPHVATPPLVASRPAAPRAPDAVKTPSAPGFDVAESPGPATASPPAQSPPGRTEPSESGARGLPKLLDRLKAVKLPFQGRSASDEESAPATRD